ncbi:unnamed protein product [Caenorhabditis angaria]|uniref:Uncharacterized protein n=1 Tax=Caenorhabditis angaria TaxID=860376 RepID=A0A9P1MV84_9PELO|nr:unnamed protein product [Caenorhabditis angaria]
MVELVDIAMIYAERFIWIGEVGYSMELRDGETLCENSTVLRKMMQCVLEYFDREKMETEARIFSFVFNEEIGGQVKQSKCFLVNEKYVLRYVCINNKIVKDKLMENKFEPGLTLWNIEDARSYLLEKFGSYRKSFHSEMLKYFSSRKDIENMKFLCDLAQNTVKIAHEATETPYIFEKNNNAEEEEERKRRRIYLRILCESKKEDRKEWHFFNEDVINALEYVLSDDENDKRHEKLEKWRKNGSTITVKCFETMLDLLNIPKSRFKIVQDIEFTKNLSELPLAMGYCAMKVISPNGKPVYHQIQAQFLLFQFAVCDIYWPKSHRKSEEHENHKTKIIEEMRNIKKGYHLASEIDEIIEKFKYSKLAVKTGLASIHGAVQYSTEIPKKAVEIFLKSIGMPKSKEIRFFKPMNFAVFLKYTLMMMNIQRFFDRQEDLDLKKNIMKAWSLGLATIDDLEYWMENPFSMEFYDIEKIDKCCGQMMKNRFGDVHSYHNDLCKEHYFFEFGDPCGKRMQSKEMRRDRSADHMSRVMTTFRKNLPKIIASMCEDDDFQPVDKFLKRFIHFFGGYGEGCPGRQYLDAVSRIRPVLREETKDFLDFANIDGNWYCKKKKSEKNEENKHKSSKKSRTEKLKVVIETKIVETCQKCSEIEKENMGFARKIEELERTRTSMKKTIDEKEGDLQILNLQIKQNKLNYEEAVENHQKYVENREMKILQYEYEIEQYLDDWKNEKMKLLDENRKSRRNENEKIEKMKKRLENAKFSDRNMNRIIEELQKENNQLKVRIEIARENL